ncbi:MAG: F0F1 ATP synthase subunit epsilon, partial [Spirochaetia bacterium]|nr:F0F1 ATP synthase subunit epsilon [Spirochaetia bacterium]
MKFIIMTPNRVIDKLDAVKVSAIGLEGSFSILPGHVDLLSVLVRCIVTASGENGSTSVYAADGGVLVKQDDQVMISTPMAVDRKS